MRTQLLDILVLRRRLIEEQPVQGSQYGRLAQLVGTSEHIEAPGQSLDGDRIAKNANLTQSDSADLHVTSTGCPRGNLGIEPYQFAQRPLCGLALRLVALLGHGLQSQRHGAHAIIAECGMIVAGGETVQALQIGLQMEQPILEICQARLDP